MTKKRYEMVVQRLYTQPNFQAHGQYIRYQLFFSYNYGEQ